MSSRCRSGVKRARRFIVVDVAAFRAYDVNVWGIVGIVS
jgi:hypothetical protein